MAVRGQRDQPHKALRREIHCQKMRAYRREGKDKIDLEWAKGQRLGCCRQQFSTYGS